MAQKDDMAYAFPKDLIEAQDELDDVRGELRRLLGKQPWSAEPLPAWTTHETVWRVTSRPDSPGWNPADRQRIATLRARELALATVIVCHSFWRDVTAAERATARTQLKHHRDRNVHTI